MIDDPRGSSQEVKHCFIRHILGFVLISLFFLVTQTIYDPLYGKPSKISLNIQDVTVEKALEIIEQNSTYHFLYNNTLIDVDRKISLSVKNQPVNKVLDEIFMNTDVVYSIEGNQIVLSTRSVRSVQEHQSANRKITGTIVDEEGVPVVGANIVEDGSSNGSISDVNGKFSMSVRENATLTISCLGFTTVKINVGDKNEIQVQLKTDSKYLDEVVVVGYGTQKKVNLTGAVDVISDKEFKNRQSTTVSQLLQGTSPGFNFSIGTQNGFEPGATMNVTIRGMGSLNGGSPYVVIDGFPGDMNNLNPEDIESISVLKDAASSSIYGARAPYGVILITTKKGERNSKVHVSYTGNVIIKTPQKLPESLDSYTWSRVQNEAGDNRGGHPISDITIDRIIAYQNGDFEFIKNSFPNWPDGATHFGAAPEGTMWDHANRNYANTDWWDVYYGHSVNQKHEISLSGGTKKVSYYFSGGYIDDGSVLNYGTDYFKRFNILAKVNVSITDWWDFGYESRFAKKVREKPNMTKEGDYSFMFRHISRAYPITPLYDGFGHYLFESHIPSITSGTDKQDDVDNWNNFRTEIRPLKGWKINADFAFNTYNQENTEAEKYIYEYDTSNQPVVNGVSVPNNLTRRKYIKKYWNSNVYSSYDFSLGEDHNFTVLAGMQFERGNQSWLQGYKTDMISEDNPSFANATGDAILTEALGHSGTEGFFARLNYNYKEKYLVEMNVRRDGSYVFSDGKRWGTFPSFSFGWNVNKEKFWEAVKPYVNKLKFRFSWGQLGNQNISPYSDLELVPISSNKLNWIFNYGSTRPVGYTSTPSLVNKNLTWETASTTNVGIDMTFLDDRLTATAEWFERRTTDMVGPTSALPGVLGASVPRENNATLRTRGWEIILNWKQAFENGFSYNIGASLYDYTSEVTKYLNPTGTLSTWYKGRKVGDIWGYTVNDLFRTEEELNSYLENTDLSFIASEWNTGDLRYEDTNHDGKVNNGSNTIKDHGDLKVIGNDQPHMQYTLNLGASYKGFDFSMIWRGVGKKDVYFYRMANIFWGFTNGWWESTLQPRNLDYFRDKPGTKYSGLYEGDANINTDAYWPRPYLNGTQEAKNKNHPNTRYLQDASYLRLQNVQLGYTISNRILNKLHLNNVRIFFSGENLITFTHIPDGIDPVAPVGFPEGGSGNYYGTAGTGRLTYGADRIYSFGITVTY